ncbi:MAG: 4-(cytidine 5'-diphospho)-2-C-methyl-D-erythritol kinase [Pseudomonadota bacterium]
MSGLKETARAKVNLTLKVLGRRADGFHQIESLVAFASDGDRLEFAPGDKLELSIEGAFGDKLQGDNLVLQAARLLGQRTPGIPAGTFRLVKRLPVAAGVGGGSADAAAALRLMQRASQTVVSTTDMSAVAEALGSDVPVCLLSRAALMRGRGEDVSPVDAMPALPAVLANPGAELGAGEVYAALDVAPVANHSESSPGTPPSFDTSEQLVELVRSVGNDLADAAIGLAPVIGEVRAELAATDGCLVAEMSGSGSTCFGIYGSVEEAQKAASNLTERHPDWWIISTELV